MSAPWEFQPFVGVEPTLVIDTKGVNLEPGNDHNPAFFGTDDSWVTMDPVPADKIINVYEIDFGKVGA